jgi:SAM-dependent methyltransferase
MLEYRALNTQVFNYIPATSKRVLDIGCGTGSMGKALKQTRSEIKVVGITYSKQEAEEAECFYDKIYIHDLNDISLTLPESFDTIIFSHVLEHTYQPEKVLLHYLRFLEPGGKVVIALPNVLFFKQRWQFIRGRFRYNDGGGPLDSTHYRFFDGVTSKELLENAGLKLLSARGYGAFPQPGLRRILPSLSSKIDSQLCRIFPGLFAYQYVLVGEKMNDR